MMDLRTIFLTETQFYTLLKAAGKQGKDQIFNIVTEWALASNVVRGFSIVNLAIHFVHSKKLKNALNLVILFSDELRGKREPLGAFLIKELQSANIVSTFNDSMLKFTFHACKMKYVFSRAQKSMFKWLHLCKVKIVIPLH